MNPRRNIQVRKRRQRRMRFYRMKHPVIRFRYPIRRARMDAKQMEADGYVFPGIVSGEYLISPSDPASPTSYAPTTPSP